MDLKKTLGFEPTKEKPVTADQTLLEYANIKLAAIGCPYVKHDKDDSFLQIAESLIANYQEQGRQLVNYLPPANRRVQDFLSDYLKDVAPDGPSILPTNTFALDRHGLARIISLPANGDKFESDIIHSFRLHNGVLHNPKSDRRTTKGVFHIAEGGLPIPADKKSVPKVAFARLYELALRPPESLLELPFTYNEEEKAKTWITLLLRPLVCPEVGGVIPEKRMEIRFFAPGNMACNLDFVESIFGNAGDPFLPENDAGLDGEGWTGHTGCIILAPHLTKAKKKELGLPHISEATDLQKRDGMCWESEDELYNDGGAFKITARDSRGIMVTLIADNYFGYCKKEVKTQISMSANLYGLAEEEHAGGAIAFASYDLGEEFRLSNYIPTLNHTLEDLVKTMGDAIELQPGGWAIDKTYPDIHYLPQDVHISLQDQQITWTRDGEEQKIRLQPKTTYILPSGYKVEMVRPADGRRWRLIGTRSEGVFCHKPCTVSGGGKSEISKSISDAIIHGPVIVADFNRDMDKVEEIINKEYGERFKDVTKNRPQGRKILASDRSLGSVVKLLTPSPEYKDEYNDWLHGIPYYVKELVFVVKRFYKPDWGGTWRERFNVDLINGEGGNELKYRNSKLLTAYLRVGFTDDGSWRTFGLRKDFWPAQKLQTEDDISASVVFPIEQISGLPEHIVNPSVKIIQNCEHRLFQRPDEAIHRGYDKRAEADMAEKTNFFSNYEPLDRTQVEEIAANTITFNQYTKPIQDMILEFLEADAPDYLVLPSHPRIVDGMPSKNPRYLQDTDQLVSPRNYYIGEVGRRLQRRVPMGQPVPQPVTALLPGRRNNPPEPGIGSLAVYNPVHFMPLPEFFMEVISSMTGKSPSTTGAGSEGALTKGPFNALPPIVDLNNALVSCLVTGYQPFITAAAYVGPKFRTDHDISLLVPEIWCRLRTPERDPAYMIENGFLEKCEDIVHDGKTIPSSILGYRITERFVSHFFGRVFANPSVVLSKEMLKPELQDMNDFADGIENVMLTHKRVSALYFEDGSIAGAIPPLKALLHIMKDGHYEGKTLKDPEVREMFDREKMMASDWYLARLKKRQDIEIETNTRHLEYIHRFLTQEGSESVAKRLKLSEEIEQVEKRKTLVSSPERIEALKGTIGTDPFLYQ